MYIEYTITKRRYAMLITEPTDLAQWHYIVSEAQYRCGIYLGEDVGSYVVFLLMRFTKDTEIASKVMTTEYLKGLNKTGCKREEQLRDVGDCCLLQVGFFPRRIRKLAVSSSYFIGLGRSAYGVLSEDGNKDLSSTYAGLSDKFVDAARILDGMCGMYKKILFPINKNLPPAMH